MLLALLFADALTPAQNRRRGRRNRNQVAQVDTTSLPKLDSAGLARRDSLFRLDSLRRDSVLTARADSADLVGKSSLDRPAFTGAKDSIIEIFTEGARKAFYYGDVTVTYGNMKLTADYMEYDMKTGTVFARGTYDSLTREWKGQPVMTQDGQTYNMEEVRYNFNSKKAKIKNMITQEAEGLIQGQSIKMAADRSISITRGRYTVCDLDEPHYYMKMSFAKVITQPSQKIVIGPSHLVVEGVEIPLYLPFGFVPNRPQRATGLLMPTIGEESARGFYLRDLGMYFVLGDYFDLSVTGDIFTLGSWALDVNSRYKVNYKFNGNFAFNYSNDQTGEKGSTDFFQSRNFGLQWSHSQDSKARPGMSFTASVNFSSPSNSRYNSRDVTEALQNQISSSISFSRNWNGKFNLSINALHNQNSRDSSYAITFPNVTFSVSRFYPFKQKNRVGKERIYEKISLSYNTALQNRVNFKLADFDKEDFSFIDQLNNGMQHTFSIGLPTFSLFKYLNFTPGVSYGMNWFFRSSEAFYNEETGRVETKMGKQFGDFGATHNYSGSLGMSTRLYGMYNFGKFRRIQAIRHVVSPTVSFSYSPDKATSFNGWRTLTYTDKSGVEHEYDYNIYAGQMYGYPGKGSSASMSLSIANNIEAKVRDIKDTTGTGSKKIKLIDQLNFSTGYNFLADSLKMNNIGVTMSTSVFGKLGMSANANFDPYAIDEQGRRINTFNVVKEGWLHPLRLTNASASLSYSISGQGAINGNDGRNDGSQGGGGGGGNKNTADYYRRIYYHPLTGEYIPGGWLYYTNPNVPWSVNFNYSFSYSKSYSYSNNQLITNHRYTQTLGLSGNVKLTPKMSLNATSGFDLMAMKMTTTQLSASYDLHCFNIAVSWVPSGTWQSYSFRISANASALADLLRYKKSSSYWDN